MGFLAVQCAGLASLCAADRLISIPDIHGDFQVMQRALALVEPLTETDQLVFTGDFVDRGPHPQECYEKAEELAKLHNVTRLIGNHEWVNLMGVDRDGLFARYVNRDDLASFGGWPGRKMAFSASGDLGMQIREGFDVMALKQIPSDPQSRTLFVHAGVSLETMNKYGSAEAIQAAGKEALLSDQLHTDLLDEILQTRHLAQGMEPKVCDEVLGILKVAKAERMVLGHTPTSMLGAPMGTPLIRCEGRLLLMDVAMSMWMGGGEPAALILETGPEGTLTSIVARHGRGYETRVPILEPLNDYSKGNEL